MRRWAASSSAAARSAWAAATFLLLLRAESLQLRLLFLNLLFALLFSLDRLRDERGQGDIAKEHSPHFYALRTEVVAQSFQQCRLQGDLGFLEKEVLSAFDRFALFADQRSQFGNDVHLDDVFRGAGLF